MYQVVSSLGVATVAEKVDEAVTLAVEGSIECRQVDVFRLLQDGTSRRWAVFFGGIGYVDTNAIMQGSGFCPAVHVSNRDQERKLKAAREAEDLEETAS